MTQYKLTPAQSRYLRKHYARLAASAVCCDCPGCDQCVGFVTGCICDYPPSKLKELLQQLKSKPRDEAPPF